MRILGGKRRVDLGTIFLLGQGWSGLELFWFGHVLPGTKNVLQFFPCNILGLRSSKSHPSSGYFCLVNWKCNPMMTKLSHGLL